LEPLKKTPGLELTKPGVMGRGTYRRSRGRAKFGLRGICLQARGVWISLDQGRGHNRRLRESGSTKMQRSRLRRSYVWWRFRARATWPDRSWL